MATLTLGKSVTIDAVQSKRGDAVRVERRRRVVAPGTRELREEPVAPAATKNAADEKLRAVLEAARAREEQRRAREVEEEAARAAREAEIAREAAEYEHVKSQLAARESVAAPAPEKQSWRKPNLRKSPLLCNLNRKRPHSRPNSIMRSVARAMTTKTMPARMAIVTIRLRKISKIRKNFLA